ncbi:Signal transduction regulator [Halanaeroarchaeum sp. HSR-CO]|uniref:bacterio-opsin activator domain-containing protein n=1 Tax=Halanaeroarchaeum sp. HSR-CO TaxID=2866382 RepID=UPI00217CF893|nr:bacterio-opsin activator domain-containing protein [Halanaeroarchaeum sp. HSR-CO]UWG48777.1 Signal transduction regulator [Halanaeroarchaeum sp. HSR-CO]
MPEERSEAVASVGEDDASAPERDEARTLIGLGTDGRIRSWNRPAEELTGFAASDVVGDELDVLVAEDDGLDRVTRALERVADGEQFVDRIRLQRKGGGRFTATVTIALGRGGDGERTGYLCSIEVAAAGTATNRAFSWNRRWLQILFDESPHAIAVHDDVGRIQAVNEQIVRDLGHSRDALRSMNVAEYDVAHDRAELREMWAEMETGDRVKARSEHRRKDGTTFPVEVWVTKLGLDDEALFLALGRDVSDQREREQKLERQRTSLQRIQQITESLRPLNRSLARASTREEIQSLVCEQLAATDSYRLAWYGEYEPLSERIVPRASAGFDDGYLDSVEIAVGAGNTALGPAGRAARTGEVHASRKIVSDRTFEPWREEALARGFRSGAAIPVVIEGNVHGVVGVYADRPNAFDEYERGLLGELGERVGHALHAAEQRRLLHSDAVEELVFRTEDERSPFVAASDRFDCRLELQAVIPADDNAYVCYLDVEGTEPERVASLFEDAEGVSSPRVVSADGTTGTIEYRVCDSPVTKLLEYDASVSSAVIEDGVETVHGQVTPKASTKSIIAGMQSAYSDLQLVAKRTVDRPFRTTEGVKTAIVDMLTDRQREVLSLAYHAGFFESPRRSTGDELADVLGIAAPTFYLHVRRGTVNVLEQLEEFGILD